MTITITCNSLQDTEKLAQKFSQTVKDTGAFVCLFGEVGAGKTAFVKFVCSFLGVTEKVTSPSFVILNEYKSGYLPVCHFDLYRLEKEGISTIVNELEEYSYGKILTFVEWAEFSENALPFERIDVNIEYVDENKRKFTFTATGENNKKILYGLNQ